MEKKKSSVFTSLKMNESITLKNRLVMSPMCQYQAINGEPNAWHYIHYTSRAIGGVAAIIQEATAICPEGRISNGDLGIWNKRQLKRYKKLTAAIKSHQCIPGIQLAHAGRKASTEVPWLGRAQIAPTEQNGWETVSSSTLRFDPNDTPPKSLSVDAIEEVVKGFKKAAKRAVKAGYEIIELHAAHGYLIHQFLSPLINRRKDDYGGSFENRIRFLCEIVTEVKSVLTTQSLWVRISATDWAKGGWTTEESILLANVLCELGVEVMDVSSGAAVLNQKIVIEKNYQVGFASQIKEQSNLLVGAVGLLFESEQIEKVLDAKQADFVLIGRELLRDPYFPLTVANELKVDVPWPISYERAKVNRFVK